MTNVKQLNVDKLKCCYILLQSKSALLLFPLWRQDMNRKVNIHHIKSQMWLNSIYVTSSKVWRSECPISHRSRSTLAYSWGSLSGCGCNNDAMSALPPWLGKSMEPFHSTSPKRRPWHTLWRQTHLILAPRGTDDIITDCLKVIDYICKRVTVRGSWDLLVRVRDLRQG